MQSLNIKYWSLICKNWYIERVNGRLLYQTQQHFQYKWSNSNLMCYLEINREVFGQKNAEFFISWDQILFDTEFLVPFNDKRKNNKNSAISWCFLKILINNKLLFATILVTLTQLTFTFENIVHYSNDFFWPNNSTVLKFIYDQQFLTKHLILFLKGIKKPVRPWGH